MMIRRILLASAGVLLAPAAQAQTQAQTQAPPPAATGAVTTDSTAPDAAAPEAAPATDIVVTGSRIVRPDFAAPNPITSVSAETIQRSGNTNLTDYLLRIPALSGSLDSSQTSGLNAVSRNAFGGAGLNELNLRNLGTNRTLVLVDGRRHVAGEFNTAAVDVSTIPTDLVARVDVLTGGTSAVYGADGVSGVVNFVLKHDFEGLSARFQNGISRYGDAGNRFGSAIAGHNFAGGRGNLTLAYEYSESDPLANDDRAYLRQNARQYIVTNNANPNGAPNLPLNVLVSDLRYPGESVNGAVDVGLGYPTFDGNGQPFDPGTRVGYYTTGGSSTPVAGYVGDILPEIERHTVNLLGHYDFSDAFKVSVEGKFVQNHTRTLDQFTGDYPSVISLDNPFIPASIRAAALNLPVPSSSVNISRDNEDFGRHGEDDLRRTYRGVIDVAGTLTDHAKYDAYVTYGQNDTRITKIGDRLADRYLAAIDVVTNPATGQPVCRSTLDPASAAGAVTFTPGANSGCVPLNLFGFGSPNPAALAFVHYNDVSNARITQLVANASLTGDFGAFFRLPGGPVQFAVGGEYRRETSRFSPDPYLVRALFYEYDENPVVNPSFGAFNVKEGFGELNAPILADVPFAKTLSVGAAARYSDYSTSGGTKAWQFNAVYAPISDVTFRGSYSRSVRAPNIGELFAPPSPSQNYVPDPCDPTALGAGSSYRAANCAAILRSVGADPATFNPLQNNPSPQVFGTVSGNVRLSPEEARTWTAGIVLRPRFIPGLTVSLDWYDIRITGAIAVPNDPGTLVALCVDQATINNVFCSTVSRAQKTGYINGFTQQPVNVALFSTAGADLNLDYLIHTASAGTFDLRLVGGYLNRAQQTGTPGAPVEDDLDQSNSQSTRGGPRWQFNFGPSWTRGAVTLAYNLHYRDATRREPKATTDGQPNYAPANLLRYSELWEHDVQIEYRLPRNFSIYGGVTNLTDQRPDPDATNQPISPLGRFLYVGARVNIGGH